MVKFPSLQWNNGKRLFERKVYACLTLLLLGFVPILTAGFFSLREILTEQRVMARSRAEARLVAETLRAESNQQAAMVTVYVLTGENEFLDKIADSQRKFFSILKILREDSQSTENRQLIDEIEGLKNWQIRASTPGFEMRKRGSSTSLVHKYLHAHTHPIAREIDEKIQTLVEKFARDLDFTHAYLSVTANRLVTALVVVSLFALFFVTLIAKLLLRVVHEKRRADLEQEKLFRREMHISQVRKETVEVVAHDLKNPLSALRLRMQLLRNKARSPDLSVDTESALKSIGAMEKLISDLLDHAKIEAGYLALEKNECDFISIARECVERVELLIRAKAIDVRWALGDGDFPKLVCDPVRIGQVFSNLLDNAIKFTPVGGQIELGGFANSRKVVFSVRDSGAGISREKLPHIFERFWQDGVTAKQGTGLGLAIAKGIVEGHGGKIWAESRLGGGTDFYVSLPAASELPGSSRYSPGQPPEVLPCAQSAAFH